MAHHLIRRLALFLLGLALAAPAVAQAPPAQGPVQRRELPAPGSIVITSGNTVGAASIGSGLSWDGTTLGLTGTPVSPGSYGAAGSVPTFTVDAYGRLSAAGSVPISIPPSGINAPIPNAGLVNPGLTIAGHLVALGGSQMLGVGDLNNLGTGVATALQVAAGVTGGVVTGGASGRGQINFPRTVTTLDADATGGATVYGDAQVFDAPVCFDNGNNAFCRTTSTATGSGASTTLTGVTLPLYIAAPGVLVSGTNIATATTVVSYTGTPGGSGTVTLNNLPTGTVTSVNFSPPSNVVGFTGIGTTTINVTATQSTNTLTLSSNAWCAANMTGQPITITPVTPGQGLGPNGGAYTAILTGCLTSNQIAVSLPIDTPQIAASQTVSYGYQFSSADIGKSVMIGLSSGASTSGTYTINAVYSPGYIGLTTGPTAIVNAQPQHVVLGHDDSAAVGAACHFALSLVAAGTGTRVLNVPVAHFVPSFPWECLGLGLRGYGRLIIDDGMNGNGSPWEPQVIPPEAPVPPPPPQVLLASRDLRNAMAAGNTVSVIHTYDSLGRPMPNALNPLDSYPNALSVALRAANPNVSIVDKWAAIGGATMANLDGNPNATLSPCLTSTGTGWLSQIASNCPGQIFTMGGGNNDGLGLTLLGMSDVFTQAGGVAGGAFAGTPMDIVAITHHNYSRIHTPNSFTNEDQGSSAAGYICGYAQILGYPCIDVHEEAAEHLWGMSTRRFNMARAYDVSYGTNALSTPWREGRVVWGQDATFYASGKQGTTFWNQFTGNGGVSDARGPAIIFNMNYDNGSLGFLWLFNPGANGSTLAFECDLSQDLPGLACDDPATGKPPVVPTMLSNLTVTNNAGAGPTTVSASKAVFQGCVPGAAVTVPRAGASYTIPGYGATINPPFISTVQTCTSNTSIVVNGISGATFASQSGVVMWGTPVITSPVTDTGCSWTTTLTNDCFHVGFAGDRLNIWWNSPENVVYNGRVARSWARYTPLIMGGGSHPALNVLPDNVTNAMTSWSIATPVKFQTDLIDADVNGPPIAGLPANAGYIGGGGGDGNNHDPQAFASALIRPAMFAQNLALGSGTGISAVVPTTGQTITVPNDTGSYLVNPAGALAALTVNLPSAGYRVGDKLAISLNQAITSLTITPATGQTVKGASVTTATAGMTLIYRVMGTAPSGVALSYTWQRMQ